MENEKKSKRLRTREQSMIYSLLAFVYIVLVALLMNNGNKLFGNNDKGILAPIGILLLLVLSVAVMGILIFGKAIIMYLDGEKKRCSEIGNL